MASREERMQQRLRGAQRRQVKDVDFGLVFPAAQPGPDLPSAQISPQPELPQAEILQQIPNRASASHLQPSNPAVPADTISPGYHSTFDANTSAKRRKLNADDTTLSSSRSTRSQRLPRPDAYAVENDQQDETVLDMLLDTTNELLSTRPAAAPIISQPTVASTPATQSRARTPPFLPQVVDEVIESPRDLPGSGRRIRRSVGVASSSSEHVHDGTIAQAGTATPIQRNKRKRGDSRTQTQVRTSRQSQQSPGFQDDSLGLDELSPEQPVLPRSVVTERSQVEPVEGHQSEQQLDDNEQAEAIGDEQAADILKRNQGRRLSRRIPADLAHDNDPVSPPATRQRKGRHRINSAPARQRQPKQAVGKKTPAKTTKKSQIGSPIPVTVHRFTNPLIYNDEEEDADILNSEIPKTRRAGVNTIDVLMEVSGEIVGAAMQTLDDGGRACEDAALRREYQTKWRAVAAFGNELQTRLLEHTINLDNGYSLDRRLRDEQKKKLRLRDEILCIRAEREQVSLRIDEVRIKHEHEKTKALSQDSLNANVHDIELAIDLGKERQLSGATEMVGTEVLLKRVAGEVSSKADSGGLLRQIKSFNAFLERAALALESSKV